jgi:hypothetical protein
MSFGLPISSEHKWGLLVVTPGHLPPDLAEHTLGPACGSQGIQVTYLGETCMGLADGFSRAFEFCSYVRTPPPAGGLSKAFGISKPAVNIQMGLQAGFPGH